MANKFTRYLTEFIGLDNVLGQGGLIGGLANPKGNMGTYAHASRLFVDDTLRLAPRTKFNYFVSFELDNAAHNATKFTNKHLEEFGLLIKTAELPKFNFDSVTKNQYNRKKIIYKMINYDPINLTFHDDNQGITSALWTIYYGYYANDRHLPMSAYEANHYRTTNTTKDLFRYGLDKDTSVPLFKSISIYTMARRRFLQYKLINPRIKTWNHGGMDYADGATPNENAMTLEYEAVVYGAGNVSFNRPAGFANLHYDTAPSPLSVAGGGVASILGEGGVLDGLESIFGDLQSGSAFESPAGFLGTVLKGINTYKNYKRVQSSGRTIGDEVLGVLSTPEGAIGAINTIGGIAGAVFPKNTGANETTTATPKILATGGTGV